MQRSAPLALLLLFFTQAAFPASRVVVIGIRDYQNAFTNPVPVALNDADRFAGFSKTRALDTTPLLLKSADPHSARTDDATLTKVENELSGAFSQAEAGDTIYLFISARGIARGN